VSGDKKTEPRQPNLSSFRTSKAVAAKSAMCAPNCARNPGGQHPRDITCDVSVMAEMAQISQCDGVMARIAYVFS
jgi:hypothetical protein